MSAASPRPRVVFLDALGTLLTLEPPAPRLAAAIGVSEEVAGAALRAEIAYYRAHHHEARDLATLADLRARCTAVLQEHLPAHVPDLHDALMASLRFTPFPEVEAVLETLRAAGLKLVVVSNWDVSLHEALLSTGLTRQVDAAISSAEAGAAKPDPAIFTAALALAGDDLTPDDAVHVGDEAVDVEGAHAAGIRPILVRREAATVVAAPAASAPPDVVASPPASAPPTAALAPPSAAAAPPVPVLSDLTGLPALILP